MDNLESSSRKHLDSLSLATPRMHTQALTLIWMHMMKQHHISYIPSQNFVKLISRNFEIPQKFRENIFFYYTYFNLASLAAGDPGTTKST